VSLSINRRVDGRYVFQSGSNSCEIDLQLTRGWELLDAGTVTLRSTDPRLMTATILDHNRIRLAFDLATYEDFAANLDPLELQFLSAETGQAMGLPLRVTFLTSTASGGTGGL